MIDKTTNPYGITTTMAIVVTPKGNRIMVRADKLQPSYPSGYTVLPDDRPAYNRGDGELDNQFWRKDA